MHKRPVAKAPKNSSIKALLRTVAEATGVGAVARAAMQAKDAIEEKIADQMRAAGATDEQVKRFHRLVARGERVQDALAVAFPIIIPSPSLLRAAGGAKRKRR